MPEYQRHRRECHKWVCPACETSNSALTFPACGLCGNRLDRHTGEDLAQVLERRLKQVSVVVSRHLGAEGRIIIRQ